MADSILKTATAATLAALSGITDASYPGDPSGTDANQSYFVGNVHNYVKDISKILVDNTYQVSSKYDDMGNPFFGTIGEALTQILEDHSGESSKALIMLDAKPDTMVEDLTLNLADSYIIIIGKSKYGDIIEGTVNITTGITIFENITFDGSINIQNAIVIFNNCRQKSGATTITGDSNVQISNSDLWGPVFVSGNNNQINMSNIDFITADEATTIELASLMTNGKYIFSNLRLETDITEGTAATEKNDIVKNAEYFDIFTRATV